MATYSFSYSVIATDTDVRAATPIDNDVTVSGSHTHTPPTLSPFTTNLELDGAISMDLNHYSGSVESSYVNAAFAMTFTSTTWSISPSRTPETGWIDFMPSDSGTYRTGTSGSVEVNITWTHSDPINASTSNTATSSGTTGWVAIGSATSIQMSLEVLGYDLAGDLHSMNSDTTTGTLTVSMRYAENNAVTVSGSKTTTITLTAWPGNPP